MIPVRISGKQSVALWALIRKVLKDNPDSFGFVDGLRDLIKEAGIKI